MTRYTLEGMEMKVLDCGNCGVKHAIPAVMYDNCVEEGGYWHCPNGHSRGFKEGKRAREAVQRERDRLKQENARLEEEAQKAERARLRAVGDLKRHKIRASNGTCPCCNRTFANMTKHMKTKHPDYNVVQLRAEKT
jgi:hypothetical protein